MPYQVGTTLLMAVRTALGGASGLPMTGALTCASRNRSVVRMCRARACVASYPLLCVSTAPKRWSTRAICSGRPWRCQRFSFQTLPVLTSGAIVLTGFSYYLLHKPSGVVSQRRDPYLPSVYDLFAALVAKGSVPGPAPSPRVSAVGRLDRDTTGVMLLTDDALLNTTLLGVKDCEKKYILTVKGCLQDEDEQVVQMREPYRYQRKSTASGNEVWTLPAEVRVLRTWREEVPPETPAQVGDRTAIEVRIGEGRHHQVRRLCWRSRLRLLHLHRAAVGPLSLGGLPEGAVRPLVAAEQAELLRLCNLPPGRRPPVRQRFARDGEAACTAIGAELPP